MNTAVVEHVVFYVLLCVNADNCKFLLCGSVGVSTYCFLTFRTWGKHVASMLISRLWPVPRPSSPFHALCFGDANQASVGSVWE